MKVSSVLLIQQILQDGRPWLLEDRPDLELRWSLNLPPLGTGEVLILQIRSLVLMALTSAHVTVADVKEEEGTALAGRHTKEGHTYVV